jgi:phosphoglycerol transferase MdoB-like AlkP superfamily enzyme
VFGQSLTVKKSIATYQNLLRDAFGILGRDDLAIIFIHFSIPHPPYIYDLGKSDFSLANNRYSGYTGNLVLVDRTLGEIRHYMEKNGTWDKSHIIITSDHWWRKSTKFDGKGDHRVPFLVKLAGQEETINYQPAFNTLIIHDLILALLRGKIAQPKRVVEWIHKNGKPFIPVEVPGFD